MSNILNHNYPIFQVKLSTTDYWDHHLYINQRGDEIYNSDLQEECLAVYIDTNLEECVDKENNSLTATQQYYWANAVNNGVELNNIGLTGMDNGLITFDKDSITPEEFLELYQNSIFQIDKDDYRLIVNPVQGNNKLYDYPLSFVQENDMNVAKLNGGFFQGFFQLNNGCDYKILPTSIDREWCLEFTIKPQKENNNILSSTNGRITLNEKYPENKGIFFYIGTRAENKWYKYYNDITNISDLKTSNNIVLEKYQYSIQTDNKFISYNRTPNGFTTLDDVENPTITIIQDKEVEHENYFTAMNRTPNGHTVFNKPEDKLESIDYDVLADVINNAFALQVREDGSVGYKYLIRDCDKDEKYSVTEEFSYGGMINYDEWNVITLRIQPIVKYAQDLYNYNKKVDKMRLLLYVNGKIVLVSKELPMLDLRKLNDEYTKQEGVPYNISLGGGTQGLMDVIYENYTDIPTDVLYLEKGFAGSFIGLFKSFKFYTCEKNYNEINANYRYEINNLK